MQTNVALALSAMATRTHNDFFMLFYVYLLTESLFCVVYRCRLSSGCGAVTAAYELTLLTAFKRSWFLLSNWPIMPIDPSPPPMPPNPNFKSFCTSDEWCKWLPTKPPTPWFARCPLCGPWPCEFCDDNMAEWSCCCCCALWCCCCCCWDDFIESCFIFSCSSRSRLAWLCRVRRIYFFREEETRRRKQKLNSFRCFWPKKWNREKP